MKNPNCMKPWCGVGGTLCVDCVNWSAGLPSHQSGDFGPRGGLLHLTDTLKIDPRALDVLTFKMKDGTAIRSDRLVFIDGAIDIVRDTRPLYSGPPFGKRILMGYLPPLATGEVTLRFRLLVDSGGNLLTLTKPLSWPKRAVWKIGYAIGYLLGLASQPKPKTESVDFFFEDWQT